MNQNYKRESIQSSRERVWFFQVDQDFNGDVRFESGRTMGNHTCIYGGRKGREEGAGRPVLEDQNGSKREESK